MIAIATSVGLVVLGFYLALTTLGLFFYWKSFRKLGQIVGENFMVWSPMAFLLFYPFAGIVFTMGSSAHRSQMIMAGIRGVLENECKCHPLGETKKAQLRAMLEAEQERSVT